MKLNYFLCAAAFAMAANLVAIGLKLEIDPKPGDTYTSMKVTRDAKYIKKILKNQDAIKATKTKTTPTKGKNKHISLDEPLNDKAIASLIFINDLGEPIPFNAIRFRDGQFHKGKWAFCDPIFLKSNVGVDCDNELWNQAANLYFKTFKAKLKHFDEKGFIGSLVHFVNLLIESNLENISHFLFIRDKRQENLNSDDSKKLSEVNLVCRHYSTFALPVVARILRDARCPFSGSIHFDESSSMSWKYKILAGHAWNVIKIDGTKRKPNSWVVDFYNKEFVDVTKKILKNMTTNVNKKEGDTFKITSSPLTRSSFIYPYAVVSMDKLYPKSHSPYRNEKMRETASCKRALFVKTGLELSVMGDSDEMVTPIIPGKKRALQEVYADEEPIPPAKAACTTKEKIHVDEKLTE